MSELQARYFHRGCKLTFANDGKFYDCEIVSERGVPVGGLFASVANTSPEQFLEQCKAVVESSFGAIARYQNEKERFDTRRPQ